MEVWQGGILTPSVFTLNPAEALASPGDDSLGNTRKKISELTLTRFAGEPYYQVWMGDGSSVLLSGEKVQPSLDNIRAQAYASQIKALHPQVKDLQTAVLTDYDAYYYDKHRTKPLPVLKVDLNDEVKTTYYINPKTTKVLMKYETTSRINRWVYHGLHSLDFPALFFRRPLWDIVVIILLLGGASVSVTGLILTWKWGRRKVLSKTATKSVAVSER